MKPAIQVQNLSKLYQIGAAQGQRTFRETMVHAAAAPGRWAKACVGAGRGAASATAGGTATGESRNASPTSVWALRDVSFDVMPGEVIGLVGRNGAGKSTLLKVLSRITAPSGGSVDLRGRVGSLLEVGTGFHPELTGRENIYLNGAILGMTRKEIGRKFDAIVDFSEVGQFLDTPVKRYSSGMYTRLAFAVASHLEPEILIVDEVLAVGDAAFQKKCLGKMGEVSREGRTVVFVSHNMSAVKSLCSRAILIDQGKVANDGPVDEVVNAYLTGGSDVSATGDIPDAMPRQGTGEGRFRSVRITGLDGAPLPNLYFRQPFRVTFACEILKEMEDAVLEVSISTPDGTHVSLSTTMDGGGEMMHFPPGLHEVTAEFGENFLLPRQYSIDLGLHRYDGTTVDYVQRVLDFTVLKVAENGVDHYRWKRVRGFVRAGADWTMGSTGRSADPDGTAGRPACETGAV